MRGGTTSREAENGTARERGGGWWVVLVPKRRQENAKWLGGREAKEQVEDRVPSRSELFEI